jgi:uncharacterized membrane protein
LDDSSIYLLILIVVGIILVAPIVALVRASRASKRATALEAELQAGLKTLRELTGRIYALEQANKSQPGETAAPTRIAPPGQTVPAPQSVPEPIKAVTPISTPPPPAGESIPAIPKTAPPRIQPTPAWPNQQPTPPLRAPNFSAKSESAAAQPKRNWADMEERLGANWLNKIGTAAFVIGVALLLNYSMHYLGAEGKIILGYAISAILLVVGIIGERNERYRIAGRAVLGGGWALAYFTTYALHNIAAVRLVQSASLGFTLLFIVAIGMVLHSLRYHSEITTGFAYILAFVTIAVSEIPMGALVASALLAASLAYVLRARKWFAIEPLAIIATYVVHWMWLNQIYERTGGYKIFPQFTASVALLSAYWAIYLVSYFLREADEDPEKFLLTSSFLLNAAGYLAVLHHESFHPELRFWFLTIAGIVYLAVSGFSKATNRRLAFILASTLGMTLIIGAVPYRYSGNKLEILWLVEAEAVLIVGWRTLDAHLRKLGWAACTILAGYVLLHDLVPRLSTWAPPDSHLGWLLIALAAAYYANGQLKRASKNLAADLDDATDAIAVQISPAIATMFALSAAWIALPFMWTALVWTILAVALVTVGRRIGVTGGDRTLITCGHIAATFAFVRLAGLNLQRGDVAAGSVHGMSVRLITITISSILFYAISRRCSYPSEMNHDSGTPGAFAADAFARFGGLTALYSGAATILVADLLWRELTSAAIALAWGVFAMILLEAARALPDRPLLIQSRILLLASFARIFFADLNSVATIGHFSARVVTVSILSALYFYVALTSEETSRFRAILFWLGTISIVSLIRFQISAEWVAVAWAALVVVLYFAGGIRKLATFRDQSFGLALLVGVRCAFDNFYQIGRWHFTNTRIATVVAASALLYILFVVTQITKQARKENEIADAENSAKTGSRLGNALRRFWTLVRIYPQHLFFFVPTILLTVLLSLEVRRGYLTAAWGLEALIIFLIVLKMDERAYRWFSLLLFVLCVGRIIVHDVWNLDALGRIISFMGLGLTLLAVSFLYAKHRELLRKVL